MPCEARRARRRTTAIAVGGSVAPGAAPTLALRAVAPAMPGPRAPVAFGTSATYPGGVTYAVRVTSAPAAWSAEPSTTGLSTRGAGSSLISPPATRTWLRPFSLAA